MTILGILISFSAPRVMRTMEQSHADVAGACLRSINTAQRFYWIENRTYAPNMVALIDEGLLDSDFVSSVPRYEFSIVSANDDSFQASATRRNFNNLSTPVYNGAWQGAFTIDESGTIGGAVNGPTSTISGTVPSLTPAF